MNRSKKLIGLCEQNPIIAKGAKIKWLDPIIYAPYIPKAIVEQGTKYAGTAIGPSLPVKIQDAKGTRLDAATKKKVSHEVSSLSSGKYYDEIPLQDVFDILKKYGIVALQEDNTEWDGFLTGREGQATLPLAPIASKSAEGFYTPYSNVGLHFSWYRMPSNRYEFIVYVN